MKKLQLSLRLTVNLREAPHGAADSDTGIEARTVSSATKLGWRRVKAAIAVHRCSVGMQPKLTTKAVLRSPPLDMEKRCRACASNSLFRAGVIHSAERLASYHEMSAIAVLGVAAPRPTRGSSS